MTVTLRAASPSDDAWLDTWLPVVAASVGYDVRRGSKTNRGIIVRDGDDVGLAIWREHTPSRGDAIIELIATPASQARLGSGMQAAELLEERLRAQGARTIYAPAPAAHGIATYFWIRLGYRPLLRAEWPCEREGVAWLMRTLL